MDRKNSNSNSNSNSFLPKKEWTMCSMEEAADRRRFKELSLLECTDSSRTAHPKDRIPDPNRCVKKYRRSAAGGGVDDDGKKGKRSVDDLDVTVDYLLGIIFSTQTSTPSSSSSSTSSSKDNNNNNDFRVSLLQAVIFVDDRIRAIQVDLTTLMGEPTTDMNKIIHKVRNIQTKILRYHLLSQHLLSNLSSKHYEWKFGHKALTTAITSFLATWNKQNSYNQKQKEQHQDEVQNDISNDGNSIAQLDEIMSYTTLLHIASILNSREASIQPYISTMTQQHKWCGLTCEDGQGMAAVLGLYRKYCPVQNQKRKDFFSNNHHNNDNDNDNRNTKGVDNITSSYFPKYFWALKIASDVENGNYLSIIRLLTASSSHQKQEQKERKQKDLLNDETRWNIMTRCCMAQVMPVIRIGLLRLYNKSFMKQEKVRDDDLANILCLPSRKSALTFCQNIGLPTLSSTTDCVIMKAAPICIQDDNNGKSEVVQKLLNPGRDEDYFVFGSFFGQFLGKTDNGETKLSIWDDDDDEFKGMSSLQKAMAKAKISGKKKVSNEKVEGKKIDHNQWIIPGFDNCSTRIDEDGINILPSPALRQLMLDGNLMK